MPLEFMTVPLYAFMKMTQYGPQNINATLEVSELIEMSNIDDKTTVELVIDFIQTILLNQALYLPANA